MGVENEQQEQEKGREQLKEEEDEEDIDVGSPAPPITDPTAEPLLSSPSLAPVEAPASPLGAETSLPGDTSFKRQRRPNVRLNEIGSDNSLANVVEYLLKRKGGRRRRVVGDGDIDMKSSKHLADIAMTATPASAGKPSKKPKRLRKFKNDEVVDSKEGKPEVLTPKNRKRREGLEFPEKKRPKVILPHGSEGNGNSFMHKAMTGVAEGFLDAADGCVYGSEDLDKPVPSSSPQDHEVQRANSVLQSDSPKVSRKVPATKHRKKMGFSHKAAPVREKDDGMKGELSDSDVHGHRLQVPVWEGSLPPLDDKVKEWIQGIGLEKYASVFQHHEVGNDVLPLLTMEDLKEMGISAVGARRKFFTEITKLRQRLDIPSVG